jgi:tetratricopeptide (TPR) repeat protein
MFVRFSALLIITVQLMMFASGCEQIKEYRMTSYYAKARQLYEAQKYSSALKQLDYALEFNPDYLDAVLLRGKCQYELKHYMAAGATFINALGLDPARDDVALMIARSFGAAQRFHRALMYTADLLADDPSNHEARLLDVRTRLRSRMLTLWNDVDTRLDPLLAQAEYREIAFALLGEFYVLNNDFEKAEKILSDHISVCDDWFLAMRLLAGRYESVRNFQASARIYRKILDVQPHSTGDIHRLLQVLRAAGLRHEEKQLLNALVSEDEEQLQYEFAFIDFLMHYAHLEEAEQRVLTGMQQDRDYVGFARYLLAIYKRTGRYDEALQIVKDVLRRVEGQPQYETEFMNVLAELYYQTNNREMARFVARWILAVDSNNHDARFLLARLYLEGGSTLLAIAELRSLGSEDTKNADYDYYLGLAHMARNELSAAEQSFKDAYQKDIMHKPAILQIAQLYLDKGFFVDVEHMIDEFLAVDPDDSDVLELRKQLADKIASTDEFD